MGCSSGTWTWERRHPAGVLAWSFPYRNAPAGSPRSKSRSASLASKPRRGAERQSPGRRVAGVPAAGRSGERRFGSRMTFPPETDAGDVGNKNSLRMIRQLQPDEVLRVTVIGVVGGAHRQPVIQGHTQPAGQRVPETEPGAIPVIRLVEVAGYVSHALPAVLVGKRRVEAPVPDEIPGDAGTDIPVLREVGLGAQRRLASGVNGIADGFPRLMTQGQPGIP